MCEPVVAPVLNRVTLGSRSLVQDLLDTPNPASPAQSEAFMQFTNDRVEYDKRVKVQAAK